MVSFCCSFSLAHAAKRHDAQMGGARARVPSPVLLSIGGGVGRNREAWEERGLRGLREADVPVTNYGLLLSAAAGMEAFERVIALRGSSCQIRESLCACAM